MHDATTPIQTKALLEDLASAEHDILSLADRHDLSLDGLVDWACQSQTRRTIAGLCVLADAQTQLLLSRYRLVAATRLIAQATTDDDSLKPEQVRKACVDLLKTELTRAATLDHADDEAEDDELIALAQALAATDPPSPNTAPETEPHAQARHNPPA